MRLIVRTWRPTCCATRLRLSPRSNSSGGATARAVIAWIPDRDGHALVAIMRANLIGRFSPDSFNEPV